MKSLGSKSFFYSLIVVIFLGLFSPVSAQLQLPRIFSDGMVLQREHIIPVWGTATADDSVFVELNDITLAAKADSTGDWRVEFEAQAAGGPYTLNISTASEQITRINVYIGDLWLASGQSNMEFQVNGADSASEVIAAANDPMIRQFKIPKGLSNEPSDDLPVSSVWRPATSQYVGTFTAVGYFFAKDLREHLDIPIGIINATYGGSRIETWMSEEMLGYDETDIVLAGGQPERQPTVAYNKMIHPLLGVPIKGFIWYQGESNADDLEDALEYGELFKTMITSWREVFGLGDIPFLWVQLPNYYNPSTVPQVWDAWPQLRKGQSSALVLPNTGEAVTIDVGDVDIHPTHKQPVGHRLARIARHVAYGEDIVYSGPRYKSNRLLEDGSVEISFDYPGGGLVAEGSDSNKIFEFAVGDVDGNLSWADAHLEGDKVIVTSETVAEPAMVRYAWEFNPANANLYNAEGLPAAPFSAEVNPGFKISKFKAARSAIEDGQSTTLSWLVYGASSVTLDGTEVDTAGTQIISPTEETTYTLIAVNRDNANDIDTALVTVQVLDPNQINRALNRPATSSTYESSEGVDQVPAYAVDGNMETRWSSAWQAGGAGTAADPNVDDNPDDEWIAIDLGQAIDIEQVLINWEAAYGSKYDIEVSYDGYIWNTVFEERTSNGGDSIIFNPAVSGRFIRIHGIERATVYGYSIYEIEAYGLLSELNPPSITLGTDMGNVISAGQNAIVTATVTEGDGQVQSVSFYVDGELVSIDDSSPFSIDLSLSDGTEFAVTAIVVDDNGISVQSAPLYIYVDDGSATRFEAENADYTGSGNTVVVSGIASNYKYLDMQDAWTLTFNGIGVETSGEYLLTIAYLLNYESPKNQFLYVNNDSTAYLEFTAPSNSAWLKKGIKIPLVAGENTISIVGEWNWMSFDYIAITGATLVGNEKSEELPESFTLSQNYPNPFNPSTIITYSLPNSGLVHLEIYDITGQRIKALVNEVKEAGTHEINFNAKGLASGVYFYRIQFGSKVETKSMLLLK